MGIAYGGLDRSRWEAAIQIASERKRDGSGSYEPLRSIGAQGGHEVGRPVARRTGPNTLDASDPALRLQAVLLPRRPARGTGDPHLARSLLRRLRRRRTVRRDALARARDAVRLSGGSDRRLRPDRDPELDGTAAAERNAASRAGRPVARWKGWPACSRPIRGWRWPSTWRSRLALGFAIWREVVAGKNWKNAPVAVMITLFGLANALDHLASMGFVPHDLGQRLAIAVSATLIALIGGRIVPELHAQLAGQGEVRRASRTFRPDRQGCPRLDRRQRWSDGSFCRRTPPSALSFWQPASCLPCRLSRWRGRATMREPILFVLHVGYGWLALSLSLLGLAILPPDAVPHSAALHALTAGAVGTMTLAVMTRASLGHTGRAIVADRFVVAMYVMVSAGALLRVAAPFAGNWYIACAWLWGYRSGAAPSSCSRSATLRSSGASASERERRPPCRAAGSPAASLSIISRTRKYGRRRLSRRRLPLQPIVQQSLSAKMRATSRRRPGRTARRRRPWPCPSASPPSRRPGWRARRP